MNELLPEGDKAMDGIQTKVFCPECGKENEFLLEKKIVPEGLVRFMQSINIPVGGETSYMGEKECSCGKVIKVTFVIEAYSKDEKRPDHQIIMRGGF
jgi:hypothetical protein